MDKGKVKDMIDEILPMIEEVGEQIIILTASIVYKHSGIRCVSGLLIFSRRMMQEYRE